MQKPRTNCGCRLHLRVLLWAFDNMPEYVMWCLFKCMGCLSKMEQQAPY